MNIELLAPAKDLQSAMAAVDCGADAIYIGSTHFGARYGAANSVEDIASLCRYAHPFGVKVYVTLNTLIYDNELELAQRLARELIAVGVDALIVQDMAFTQMGLGCELHASTQTACHTSEMARFLDSCGFTRTVLERGLTLKQIRAIGKDSEIELEAFVHGAICVGYSGLCYLSRTIGSRSGNRGECAQPCRLPYDLVESAGNKVISARHLLSVRDLNLSERVEELIDAGVCSFKIEGRLKDIGYVRNTVSHYRALLDKIIDRRDDLKRSSVGRSKANFTPDVAKSFTRGFSNYLLDGKRAGVASFESPKAMGESIGVVRRVLERGFELDSQVVMAAGDGICFFGPTGLCGTNINGVDGAVVTPNSMDGIERGMEIYRNYDHRFTTALNSATVRRSMEAMAVVTLSAEAILLTVTDTQGHSATAKIEGAFEVATNSEKMRDNIRAAVAKSGSTMFDIKSIDIQGDETPFVAISQLNALRREALERLTECRAKLLPRPKVGVMRADEPLPNSSQPILSATNSLSTNLYAQRGADDVRGLDNQQSMQGEVVMRTPYCIRREIGQCLAEQHTLKGDLWLCRASARYALNFDCTKCEMTILYEGNGTT